MFPGEGRLSSKRMKISTLWVALVLVAGCATFHPQPLSPSQTAAAFEARTLESPGLRAFLETTLHRAITPWPVEAWDITLLTLAALYYHPDLDVARAQWAVAEAEVITAGGRPNPNVGFTPAYNANAASGVSPWILGLTVDIPLETAGKRRYRMRRATQLAEASRLHIAAVSWQVRSRLRTSLLDLDAARRAEPIVHRQQGLQEDIVKGLEQRFAVGEASQFEVTQAHIARDQTRFALREVQKRRAEARVRVADALGVPVGALDGVTLSWDFLEQLPPATALPAQDIRRQALLNRTDILAALGEYAASQSALQLELAKQYPDIHLGPGYAWDQGDQKWSLGFSISLPVVNRNEGPIAEAKARRTEAAARFTHLQARVIGESERALAGTLAALHTLETADALLLARDKQLQSVQARLRVGEADRLALLSAQLELAAGQVARLNALVEAQTSLGLLEDALQRPLDASSPLPSVPEAHLRDAQGHTHP